MFKRNLLKRTLPIMLSVAMTFQSVPITAMAAENPLVVVQAEADEPEPAAEMVEEESAEPAAEPVAEAPSDSEEVSDQGTEDVADGESGEESALEESADVVFGSETNDQENTGSEIEAEISEEVKQEAEANADLTETAAGVGAEKGADNAEVVTTKIEVNDEVDLPERFERQWGDGNRISYTVQYRAGQFADEDVLGKVTDAAQILVNGDEKDVLKDYLTAKWYEAKDSVFDFNLPMQREPENVGIYLLHLAIPEQAGLCKKAECYVYFEIIPQKLELCLEYGEDDERPGINKDVRVGSSVGDFTKRVIEEAGLKGEKEVKALDEVLYSIKEVTVNKSVIKENGEAEVSKADSAEVFNKYADYSFTVEVELDSSLAASKNYDVEACNKEEYRIYLEGGVADEGLRETQVVVTRNEPVKDIAKSYDGQLWTVGTITADKDFGSTAEVKVESEEKNDTEDDDEDSPVKFVSVAKDSPAAPGEAVAKLYTKETDVPSDRDDEAVPAVAIDEETQFLDPIPGKDTWDVYTLVPKIGEGDEGTEIKDAGEYYLVYMYDGKDGIYKKSHSTPIKVTIDPKEVILKPTELGAGDELKFGMDSTDVAKVLKKVESGIFENTLNAADNTSTLTGVNEPEVVTNGKVENGFYGVSYDERSETQYYSPVFQLVLGKRPAGTQDKWKLDSSKSPYKDGRLEKPETEDKIEYAFFIKFNGKKAVYNSNGSVVDTKDITEAIDTANTNYKVKSDADTLGNLEYALRVTPGDTTPTSIKTDKIIAAVAIEQTKESSDGKTIDAPVRVIYDENKALFAERKDYKQAEVADIGITGAHKDLKYTWVKLSVSMDNYEAFLKEEKPSEESKAFETWEAKKKGYEEASVSSIGSIKAPQDAGLYRLEIEYKDSENKNAPAYGEVYFLIERQEIVFAADTQYAEDSEPIAKYADSWSGYGVYKVPGNDETAAINKEDELGWNFPSTLKWQVKNIKKDAKGNFVSTIENSKISDWEDSTGNFQNSQGYTYVVAVYPYNNGWPTNSSKITLKDTGKSATSSETKQELYWRNYTTRYWAVDAENGTEGWEQLIKVGKGFGEISFAAKEVEFIFDRNALYKDKTYDAAPISETSFDVKVQGGLTIAEISPEQDSEDVVRYGWLWTDEEGNGVYKNSNDDIVKDIVVPTNKAIYGGTYTLVASFKGNGEYKRIDEWTEILDKDDNPYQFTIKPREVEITPVLKTEATAGKPLYTMLEDEYAKVDNVPTAADELLFKKGLSKIENAFTGNKVSIGNNGYPILGGGEFTRTYFENNNSRTSGLIRSNRNYDVKLSYNYDLFAQYELSYNLTYNPATLDTVYYGDPEVEGTDFFRADIPEIQREGYGKVSVNTECVGDNNYVITPQEGIPFVYDGYTLEAYQEEDLLAGQKIPLDKNYIAVNIASPREFSEELSDSSNDFAKKNFVYENSIKKAGGYVIGRGYDYDYDYDYGFEYNRYVITVLFPVELDEDGNIDKDKAQKEFSITWEKGYTDKFNLNLTDAKAEANLKKAVEPKSIAFNGVAAKMAVGEEQQLDVKITKAQLGDVIRINYGLVGDEDNKYASIDPETGRITALATMLVGDKKKPATVTVEAYPVRLAANGIKFERIGDPQDKKAKKATVKISITEVTAPTIKKVISDDESITVQYTQVNDGYRREIYVVDMADIEKSEQSKWKKGEGFEDAIGEMKNGQWEGKFAIKPEYVYGNSEYNKKLKICEKKLENLGANGSYLVYVRNVSAVRTLADGSKVTESAAGKVKPFNTKKSMVKSLRLSFVVDDEDTSDKAVKYYDEKNKSQGYKVNLTAKTADLKVEGQFKDIEQEEDKENTAVETSDRSWLLLPLSANKDLDSAKLKNAYSEPKLFFYVTDDYYNKNDFLNKALDEKGKLKNPSKIATINNKGKVTLKGVGEDSDQPVYLWVVSDNKEAASCKLTIIAKPDEVAVKGKVKSLKVGDSIRLADYLEYKQDGKKVSNYWSSFIKIKNEDQLKEQGFEINRVGSTTAGGFWDDSDKYHNLSVRSGLNQGEIIITAVKPTDGECKLQFTDQVWGDDGERNPVPVEMELALSATGLDPVKSLKTVYVDDKHITLNFAHAGNPEAFDIEVTDARGSVIYKKLAYREDAMSDAVWAEDLIEPEEGEEGYGYYGPWRQNEQTGIVGYDAQTDGYNYYNNFKYFEKTNMYAYTITSEKLMRLSSYTITVNPIYDGVSAAGTKKPASTKAKTTDIPASYGNADLKKSDWNYRYYDVTKDRLVVMGNDLQTYLLSGNTYTVEFQGIKDIARRRGTDTLTWKSSDAKVISVKANQGSFSATLKPMQQGKSTITVTSKVTKKTIARWQVAVKAVGNGKNYGGDFEYGYGYGQITPFYDDFLITWDPFYEGKVEVLRVSNTNENHLKITGDDTNDYTWVQFVAPAFGEYQFGSYSDDEIKVYYEKNSTKRDQGTGLEEYASYRLEKGQKIYFKVQADSELWVKSYTDYARLTMDYTAKDPFRAEKDMWVSFTAPEDNVYTFNEVYPFEKDGTLYDGWEGYIYDDYSNPAMGLKAGETILIKLEAGDALYVTKREFPDERTLTLNNPLPISFVERDDFVYIKFKAPAAGDYTFNYFDEKVYLEFYDLVGNAEYGNDGLLPDIVKATTYAEGDTEAPRPEKTTLFMKENAVVAVKVIARDGAETTIKVTAPATLIKDLAVDKAETVPRDTYQTFQYTIPNETTAARYTIKVENGSFNLYNAAELNDIRGEFGDYDFEFVVENGKARVWNGDSYYADSKLKVGDQIYIRVNADGYEESDAKISITKKTAGETLVVGTKKDIKLKNGFEDWYTLTVKETGYYTFTTTVEENKHDLSVAHVDGAFCTEYSQNDKHEEIVIPIPATSNVYKLTPGSYVFRIWTESEKDDTVETAASLAVNTVSVTELGVSVKEVPLTKANEVQYYSFKAATNGSYTIQWTKAEASTGTAVVSLSTNGLDGDFVTLSEGTPTDLGNTTTYIKVSQNSEAPVSVILTVAAEEKITLLSDQPKELKFDDVLVKDYIFTTPVDSALGYIVTVENNSPAIEGQEGAPKISFKSGSATFAVARGEKKSYSLDSYYWKLAYQNHNITITATDKTAVGSITIKPVEVTPIKTPSVTADIKKADSVWYSYKITEGGRYQFGWNVPAGQNEENVTVQWCKKGTMDVVEDMYYLEKGQELYAYVRAVDDKIADATVNVIVQAPTKIQPKELKVDVEETVAATAVPAYYSFKASEYAYYTIDIVDTDGAAYDGDVVYLEKNDTWDGGMLNEGDIILIKAEKEGKITVKKGTVIPELTSGVPSAETVIPAKGSASFALKLFTKGYYDIRVNDTTNLTINASANVVYSGDGNHYRIVNIASVPSSGRYSFTVENTADTEVKATVTATELKTYNLKLGTEVPVTLEEGRVNILKFAVPEAYQYTYVSSAADSKVVRQNRTDADGWYDMRTSANPSILYLDYSGTGTKEATVKVSKTVPGAAADDTPVNLEKDEVKWFAYTAAKTGMYTFTAPEGMQLALFKELDVNDANKDLYQTISDTMKAGSVVYIKVKNGPEKAAEGKLTVAFEEYQALPLGGGGLTVKNESDRKYISFTAPHDGFYKFAGTDEDHNLSYYGISTIKESVFATAEKEFYVAAGDVVFLAVYAYDGTITATEGDTKIAAMPEKLELDKYSDPQKLDGKTSYCWYTFTAEDSGYYSADGYYEEDNSLRRAPVNLVAYQSGDIYSAIPSDEEDKGSTNWANFDLKAGEKVYVKVSLDGTSDNVNCIVHIVKNW